MSLGSMLWILLVIFTGLVCAILIITKKTRSKGKWAVHNTTDLINDKQYTSLTLHAENESMGKKCALTVKCDQSNVIDIYILWYTRLEEPPKVTTRFDKDVLVQSEWTISRSKIATFCKEVDPFVKKLLGSERLVVRTTSYEKVQMTYTFSVRGLVNVINVSVD